MKSLPSAPAGILIFVFACSLAAQKGSGSFSIGPRASDAQSCSWKEAQPDRVRSPIQMDIHAGYRTFAFKSDGTVGFRVHGDYPHAAFLSFTIYDNQIVYSVLIDNLITADSNSVNPFEAGQLIHDPDRSFTVTVLPAGADPTGMPNVMYMPPLPRGSTLRNVVLEERVYLPEPGQNRFGGTAPSLESFQADDPSTPVPCPQRDDTMNTDESTNAQSTFDQAPLPHDGIIQFYRPPVTLVPFADSSSSQTTHDCTSYLMAAVFPDQIAVVHIPKVPAFFNNTSIDDTTTFHEPVDGARYISMGSYGASVLEASQFENIAGPEMKTLPDGSATFVAIPIDMSPEDTLMAQEKATELGYNFMPLAQYGPLIPGYITGPYINPFLIYRNKVPAKGFSGDIKNVACFHGSKFSNAPSPVYAASPRNMGDYAPIGVECSLSAFLDQGCGQEFHYPHP